MDRSLVAADGLHPSGAQYALWVERIRPVVEGLLAELAPAPVLQLVEPCVADPEVVGDLVVDGIGHAGRERRRASGTRAAADRGRS